MSIATVLSDFRTDMWCDIIQLPDTTWLRYYNDARDEVIDAITKEKEDYFYNYVTTSTVIWENEYKMPKRWDIASDWVTVLDWLQKIKWVSWKIKTTDQDFTVLRPTTLENLDKDIESYDETQNPFYCVMDNSVFIYPAPTEVSALKIYGIMYPKKLILTDNDTLPDQHQKAILYGVKKRFLENQTRVQEAQLADQKFEQEKVKVAVALSGRIQAPIIRSTPNINYLK